MVIEKPVDAARGRGILFAVCCVIMFLYAVYLGAVGVLIPAVRETFLLDAAQVGRLFPANFGGFVVGVLVCGYLSDRLGRKRVLLIGIALYASGLALFGGAGAFAAALAASALIGAGTGAMETVASALASDLFPERRAFVLNAIQVAFGAGAAIGPLLAHRLAAAGLPWSWFYVALALANGALFAFLLFRAVPRPASVEAVDFASLRRALAHPVFGVLCLAQALYVGAEVTFFSWMPTYFRDHLAGGAAWEGAVVTVFWIGMTAGRIGTGALVGRMPLMRLNALLAAGGAASAALALMWGHPAAVMACVGLTGLFFSGIFGLFVAEGGERFPAIAGTAFGGIMAAGGIGGALLPWVAGVGADLTGNWRAALLLSTLAAGGVAALSLWVLRRPRVRTS